MSTEEDTPLPLLGDDEIKDIGDRLYDLELHDTEEGMGQCVALQVAVERGGREVRDFYEPHILSRDAKIKSLEGLVQEAEELLRKSDSYAEHDEQCAAKFSDVSGCDCGLLTHFDSSSKFLAALSSAKALDFEPKNPR